MAQLISELSASQEISTEIVRSTEALRAMRGEWNALFQAAHNPAPPLHFDWIWTWLGVQGNSYLEGREGLRVICCRRGGKLVGVLPMYQRHAQKLADGGRQLRFISTGEREQDELCPDYMDLLCLEEVKEDCAGLAWAAMCHELSHSYDRVELPDMADDSAMVNWARRKGAPYDLQIIPRGVCPIADLAGGFDAYLSRLSSNTRQQIRRLLRAAKQSGVQLESASTKEEALAFFDEMVQLHQRRWESAGQPGCFSSVSFTSFHRQLIQEWIPSGRAVLTRIRQDDQTLAVKYGFCHGDTFYFYQSGVRLDDDCPIKSAGIVSFMLLMQHLIGRGVSVFDFLRGSSSYKQRLATTAQPLVMIRRVRWTIGTTVGFAADLGVRAMRKAGRMASRNAREVPRLRQET